MATVELRLEELLSRKVVDAAGRKAGRIEEIIAREGPDGLAIVEYHLGALALLEHLANLVLGSSIAGSFGIHIQRHGHRVRWDQLDLSDPKHLRLRCRREELPPLPRPGEDGN